MSFFTKTPKQDKPKEVTEKKEKEEKPAKNVEGECRME